MRPRIAIPTPTTSDLAYNQRSWPAYARAVELSGGEPVVISLGLSLPELRRLAESCHGIVLPGSPADVNPELYGADRLPECAPADPAREVVDFFLLDHALQHHKPVLGICFGVQSMNVWRGGTLLQDIAPLPVNHSAGASVAIAHAVVVAQHSLLATLLDPGEAMQQDGFLRLPINTSHHQAIGTPGDGLRVVARSPEDGVIEAIEFPSEMFHVEHSGEVGEVFHVEHSQSPHAVQFLGVQWHPERSFDISATSRALFAHLVAQASTFATAHQASTAL